MKVSIQQIRDLSPCYDPSKFLPEGWEGSLVDILNQEDCPVVDRIWVVVRLLPPKEQNQFARWCALQVIDLWDAPDIVREYLETGDESQRAAARDAARAAARAAARDAAWAAAMDAARAAAWAAARDAARDAARAAARAAARDAARADAWAAAMDAARAAAWAAARDAAMDAQLTKLKEICDNLK